MLGVGLVSSIAERANASRRSAKSSAPSICCVPQRCSNGWRAAAHRTVAARTIELHVMRPAL